MKKILATNCILTKGYSRTLLSDLLCFKWWAIPNELTELIENEKFDSIEKDFPDFFTLLENEDILLNIPKEDEKLFPLFSTSYFSPSIIEHALIDWEEDYSKYDLKLIINELEQLGCQNLSFRFYKDVSSNFIQNLFEYIKDSTIEATDITIPYSSFVKNESYFEKLKREHGRFKELLIHSCPANLPINIQQNNWIIATREAFNDCSSCGKISPLYFCLNMQHFTLSNNYNNCLYKKIGIDIDGNIKNCPSSDKIFGNTKTHSLNQVVIKEDFEYLGKITKDQIKVCSDCEFRYICSDCRVYTENNGDEFARPLTCNYNPYICKWQGEEGYLTLEECGVISNEQGFSIDHGKIAEINKQLWGE